MSGMNRNGARLYSVKHVSNKFGENIKHRHHHSANLSRHLLTLAVQQWCAVDFISLTFIYSTNFMGGDGKFETFWDTKVSKFSLSRELFSIGKKNWDFENPERPLKFCGHFFWKTWFIPLTLGSVWGRKLSTNTFLLIWNTVNVLKNVHLDCYVRMWRGNQQKQKNSKVRRNMYVQAPQNYVRMNDTWSFSINTMVYNVGYNSKPSWITFPSSKLRGKKLIITTRLHSGYFSFRLTAKCWSTSY